MMGKLQGEDGQKPGEDPNQNQNPQNPQGGEPPRGNPQGEPGSGNTQTEGQGDGGATDQKTLSPKGESQLKKLQQKKQQFTAKNVTHHHTTKK